ncbi:alpha/beta fold hydrolase [Streptomyces bambusae]|uniref:thioesterase II family protein n=1 Tax=Streptomyces bambusae TaxID=1550616 RepID=UPI001CFD4206|nr:alpha/beta fold hydrolase [Streptomyces bambusae]MCB5166395.1 alpha/beta fold hydrolase [Streptomyces bambusae]
MTALLRLRPLSTATTRLVCFPHAGGSAGFFRDWADHVLLSTELLAVQYPGRETRIREPLVPELHALADEITEALLAEPVRPTALFGHSMGAALAYETMLRLEAAGADHFTRLCVSGRRMSGFDAQIPQEPFSDAELDRRLRSLGGTDPEVLEHPELRDLFFPIIRNDFFLIDRYRPDPAAPRLRAEVVSATGDDDPRITPEQAAEWATVTTGPSSTHVFPGDHFYLTDHIETLARLATTRLAVPRLATAR